MARSAAPPRAERVCAAALVLTLGFALGPGSAAAQTPAVCSNTPAPNQRISCEEGDSSSETLNIDAENVVISTTGEGEVGVDGYHRGTGAVEIDLRNPDIITMGGRGNWLTYGVRGWTGNAMNEETVSIRVTGGTIETVAAGDDAIAGWHFGLGAVSIDLRNLDITTTGDAAHGVEADNGSTNEEMVSIRATGGTITAKGLDSNGLSASSRLGSVSITTGTGLTVKTPFDLGVRGYLSSNDNAEGRILVTHGGAVEARYFGVDAWAARSSGHTFGDGTQTADDAARTAPMIHVTSNGDVTVGTSVMDTFIREVVAGADGTLSTAENAVLAAITAQDSDALDAALNDLPAAYDADYKAEARDLLRRRIDATPTAFEDIQVAEEVLEIPRAGIRAMALSHTETAAYVSSGDGDTSLSAAERRVLEAVLTGTGLEMALDALPTGYMNTWKDGVRHHAASYNAGDIQVDVTGGTIIADGDGVYARYVLPHDRNGAIAVTVAEDASVTGERNGLYVGGAGAGEGNFRKQSVTVHGSVRGGTGAGVRMVNGGRLVVGSTGRISATSGVGVLADGTGDFHATVGGTVEGDLRSMGTGTTTATVLEGGTVTGTVRLAGSTVSVGGTVGRLLFATGGTATVSPTGRITGVAGAAEAIRSEAGDLAVTVAGRVEGDVRTMGTGALTLSMLEGGVVTGTVHDPAGPLTVTESIGRLLYTTGGTVTVAPTGRITGVAGEAIRSEAGDVAVTVAGTVAGDVRAFGDGDLRAMVTGTVDGDVEGMGSGDHTVAVPVGGTVTGTVRLDSRTVQDGRIVPRPRDATVTVGGTVGRLTLDDGGTVMVAATGQVTGVAVGNSHGVRVGPGSTIENHGTIAGTVGIQAGAGSTVDHAGTVRSTAGSDGIAIHFEAAGADMPNTLQLRRGMAIIGTIRGLSTGDTVDLSDLAVDEVGVISFVDETNAPVTPAIIRDIITRPQQGGVGRLIEVGHTLVGLDTTAFALTDDVLSDLTGSIHAAILGTGRPTQAHEGAPAQGYVWATPFGGWREQTGQGHLADGTHTFGGGMVGAGWGTRALYVGGFIGGSAGQLAVADNRQNVDMQTVFGGAYAQRTLRDVQLDARLLLGHVAHDTTRRVPAGPAHAAYTSFLVSPEVGVALRVPVTPTLHATPHLRVRYAGLFTESFRERAPQGNWDVGFGARGVQMLEGRGEVSVPMALAEGGQVAPRFGVEGRWLLAGDAVEGTLPGGTFRLSAGGDRTVATATLGLGVQLPVAAATTLVGNFDGALTTEHAWRATGYLGLTYTF